MTKIKIKCISLDINGTLFTQRHNVYELYRNTAVELRLKV